MMNLQIKGPSQPDRKVNLWKDITFK